MTRIIALANQKGGVGKTVTTHALGAALAERGQRVLLVDFDPQASLTSAAGVDVGNDEASIYTAMATYMKTGDAPTLEGIVRTIAPALDLLPASIDLAGAEIELMSAGRREYVLGEVLSRVQGAYDIILIDCAPSLGLLTLNALTAAGEVVIPVVPNFLASRGLGLLVDSIAHTRKIKLNPRLRVTGVLLTMVDSRQTHSKETSEGIRAFLGDSIPILGEVKRSAKAAEASAAGLPVTAYAPQSDAALAYGHIADALLAQGGVAATTATAMAPTIGGTDVGVARG